MNAVILAGGTGTRLWPLSRKHRPKQLQSLISKKTLLEETLARLSFLPKKNIFLATATEFEKEVKKLAHGRIPKENFIIEPAMRDTAAAIGFAALNVYARNPKEILAVIYADHYINDAAQFKKNLELAAKIAKKENKIVVVEVKAQYANTHLGYVKIGNVIEKKEGRDVYALERFIEKPSLSCARRFVNSYRYLWNTGLYVFPVALLLEMYKKHFPKAYRIFTIIQKTLGTKQGKNVLKKMYPKIPKTSIDYAIMEKIDPKNVRIIVADFGWSDIGNFAALFAKLSGDRSGNFVRGPFMGKDNKNCLIYNYDTKLVTALGLSDMVVVNTKDALLLCPRDRSADVKMLVAELKHHGKIALL